MPNPSGGLAPFSDGGYENTLHRFFPRRADERLVAFLATSPRRETTLLDQQVGEGVSPALDAKKN
jgi:hypothetical protein